MADGVDEPDSIEASEMMKDEETTMLSVLPSGGSVPSVRKRRVSVRFIIQCYLTALNFRNRSCLHWKRPRFVLSKLRHVPLKHRLEITTLKHAWPT